MISATAADPLAGVYSVVRPRSPLSLSESESPETSLETESTRVRTDRSDRVRKPAKDRFCSCYRRSKEILVSGRATYYDDPTALSWRLTWSMLAGKASTSYNCELQSSGSASRSITFPASVNLLDFEVAMSKPHQAVAARCKALPWLQSWLRRTLSSDWTLQQYRRGRRKIPVCRDASGSHECGSMLTS